MVLIRLGLLVLAIWSSPAHGQTDQELKDQIDTFVDAILTCNNIPGANLAVVRNGQVFHTAGYGVKNLVTQEAVTEETLMNIASLSKHFTSTTMAKTLELFPGYDWDSSVRSVLGETFFLSDGYLSSKVTIQDLLTHRVGIARHDVIRTAGYTLNEMVSRLRHLESSREFRDRHQYNNLMYNLADQVIREISGRGSWEEILQESFLDPLGMADTTFVTRTESWGQYATAYMDDGGSLREVSLEVNKNDYDLSTSAGGIASNAVDMAKWMAFQLNEGQTTEEVELVDPRLLDDTHDHSGVTGSSPMYSYPTDPVTYDRTIKAMGWFEGYYRDYRLTGHSGSKAGFLSMITLLPDVGLGVYTTLTGPMTVERDFITMYIADLLLSETAWLDAGNVCDLVDPAETKPTQVELKIQHEPLSAYEGTFGHFGYGNVSIYQNVTSGALDLQYGQNMHMYLTQNSDTDFLATGYGIYWFQTYSLEFLDDGQGNYDQVIIEFDSRAPATFIRDLDSANAPPPPELCV